MFEHLLVPFDANELSDRAMSASIELARKLGARITGFIVEPFASPPPGIGIAYGDAVKHHDKIALAHADGVLAGFAARCASACRSSRKRRIRAHCRPLTRPTNEHACDMIVMVTHSRGAFGELMWGSHAKSLMSRSSLPLLVLH